METVVFHEIIIKSMFLLNNEYNKCNQSDCEQILNPAEIC
jgi:hypothetical protein